MLIKSEIWDKKTPINGKDADFLSNHFKKDNGNDDRVLISYDGKISRIQHLSTSEFNAAEKEMMQGFINDGDDKNTAIAKTWEIKAIKEHEDGENRAKKDETDLAHVRADIDYIAIMTGVDLNV